MVILKEIKGTGSQNVNEGLETYFIGKNSERVKFQADMELLDLKREYVMNNFVYVSLRLKFEGFEEEMKER